MILIIPSLQLTEGSCTYCIKGDVGTESYYKRLQSDPLEFCKLIRRENSKSLHLDDLDSFNQDNNYLNMNSILYLANSIDIPVQLHSNFRNIDECKLYLDNGIYRVIINDLIFYDKEGIQELITEYTPSRVIYEMNIEQEIINIDALNTLLNKYELANYIKNIGINRVLYKNNNKTINNALNYNEIKSFALETALKITMFESISAVEDLWELNTLLPMQIDSVIIGKPLFENLFPCQNIWRHIEAELEC